MTLPWELVTIFIELMKCPNPSTLKTISTNAGLGPSISFTFESSSVTVTFVVVFMGRAC